MFATIRGLDGCLLASNLIDYANIDGADSSCSYPNTRRLFNPSNVPEEFLAVAEETAVRYRNRARLERSDWLDQLEEMELPHAALLPCNEDMQVFEIKVKVRILFVLSRTILYLNDLLQAGPRNSFSDAYRQARVQIQ